MNVAIGNKVMLVLTLACAGSALASATEQPATGRADATGEQAAQESQKQVEAQIEREVWLPFMAAANAFDAEGFLAVQSKDMVRVSGDTNEIHGLDRYARETRAGFERAKERGVKRHSEMRFLSRTHSGDLAYETGYFHSRATLANGEERLRYSRFEVILRNENGRWKILLDKDTSQGGTITDAMYQEAKPMRLAGDQGGEDAKPRK